MPERPPAASPAASATARNAEIAAGLLSMGFSEEMATEASRRVSSANVAVEWIFEQSAAVWLWQSARFSEHGLLPCTAVDSPEVTDLKCTETP